MVDASRVAALKTKLNLTEFPNDLKPFKPEEWGSSRLSKLFYPRYQVASNKKIENELRTLANEIDTERQNLDEASLNGLIIRAVGSLWMQAVNTEVAIKPELRQGLANAMRQFRATPYQMQFENTEALEPSAIPSAEGNFEPEIPSAPAQQPEAPQNEPTEPEEAQTTLKENSAEPAEPIPPVCLSVKLITDEINRLGETSYPVTTSKVGRRLRTLGFQPIRLGRTGSYGFKIAHELFFRLVNRFSPDVWVFIETLVNSGNVSPTIHTVGIQNKPVGLGAYPQEASKPSALQQFWEVAKKVATFQGEIRHSDLKDGLHILDPTTWTTERLSEYLSKFAQRGESSYGRTATTECTWVPK